MTATYDVSALATSAKDRIRLRIGDNDVGSSGTTVRNALIQDEEIAHYVSVYAATAATSAADDLAAARCCKAILARTMREVDTSGAGVTASRSQRFNQVKDVLRELDAQAFAQCNIVLTGKSIAAAEALKADSDWKQPPFEVGQDDHT